MRANCGIGRAAALAAALIVAAGVPAAASPESEGFVRQGLVSLQAKEYVAAGKQFNAAVKADPGDAKAAFYLGVALNRLGQFGAALEAFQRMWVLGEVHREFGFEAGWAAVARGQSKTAVALLEPYVDANPDNAKARELLGRAYIGVGRFDNAEAALSRAIALDAGLEQTSRYYLAYLAALRGDSATAERELGEIVVSDPGSQVRKALDSVTATAPAQDRAPGKAWYVATAVSVGHNDNVIGLPNGALLPSDLSQRDSNFVQLQFDTGYRWRLDTAGQLNIGYSLQANHYRDVDSFDNQSHAFAAGYRRSLDPDTLVGLRTYMTYNRVESDTSIRSVGAEPYLSRRWDRRNHTDFSFTLSESDYTGDPLSPALDRDSQTRTLMIAHNVRFEGDSAPFDFDLRGGIVVGSNDAEGNDYDYDTSGIFATVSAPLPLSMTGVLAGSRTKNDFDSLNSLAGPTGFGFAREDTVSRVTGQVSRALPAEWVGDRNIYLFARYDFTRNKSNIVFFDYIQRVASAGVAARF